ncbi:Ni,Fe-hydrogenase I small subunit [Halapricum desulfuricans]|uniref:Ni,Fe-hydrogenase I small subunit n=1 Tax=Halapricum desulfuricans TaxID=2841257 RepID=A0A897NNJ6_9EURY|nr:hypothetical protein [Halapricum desulfuricans]QSG12419.1 Ni,Fe-hydrogenase I small subunit [Halapricum desulfuricans]
MATAPQGRRPVKRIQQETRYDFLSLAVDREPGDVVSEFSAEIDAALERAIEDDLEVAWLQGQSCTGCTISLLQGEYPGDTFQLERFRESIGFHPTLMTDAGDRALESIETAPDVLVIEGSIPVEVPRSATLGVDRFGNRRPIVDWVMELAERAEVVVAVGSCAAYGGLPAAGKRDPEAARPSPTGASGVQFDGIDPGGVVGPAFTTGADLPVINVPGCPVHPDHILLTLATVLNGHTPTLDEFNRPLPLFTPLIHDDCARRPDYEAKNFASEPGEDGCLYEVGCAGVHAHCDDSKRLRNGETTICRDVGAPCIGCVEPAFWDRFTPFYETRETREEVDEPEPIDESEPLIPRPGNSLAGLLIAIPVCLLLVPLLPVFGTVWLLDRWVGPDGPIAWRDDPRNRTVGDR